MRPHGEGDVAVPGVVAADLVLVEADLVLRGLEALFYRPPGAGNANQLSQLPLFASRAFEAGRHRKVTRQLAHAGS